MPDQKFNQPYYKIHFTELDDDIMGVVSFEGEEEISGLFEFRIQLASLDSKIDSKKILNKTATFTFIRPDQSTREIHGYISSFEQTGKSRDYLFYKVVLVPRLWQLNLIFQSAVYQNIEMKELIQELLDDCKLSSGDFNYNPKNNYPKSEFWVQFRETNLNFLNRRLEHYGIYYYFDQSSDKDVVCFTDDNSKLPVIDSSEMLGFNENREPLGTKESIFEFICREKVVTGAVQLKDYNYMYPEKELISEIEFDSSYPGNFYDYGDHFENEKEANFLAEVRSQEIFCQSKIFYGISDSRLLSAGHKFSLEKHYRDDWNSEYIITSITHKGEQHNLFSFQHGATKNKPYENNFTAIPSTIDFRPARKARCPKIYGVMNAKIDDSSDGQYASIDEHGRYKVKIPFDLSDKKNGEASLFIRMAQPYAGPNYGIHFPLHKNTEVLLIFIDGDPDRPVIAASVPNPSNASPVKSNNQTGSSIQTAGNNEIYFEDKEGNKYVNIYNSDKSKNIINHIYLGEENSDKEGPNISIEQVVNGNKILMKTEETNIEITQKNGNKIIMKKEGPEIKITQLCGNEIIMSGEKGEEKIEINNKADNYIHLDHKENSITLYNKHTGSTLELGKELSEAIEFATEGAKHEKIIGPVKVEWQGKSIVLKEEHGLEVNGGVKVEVGVGAKFEAGLSLNFIAVKGRKFTICEAEEVLKEKEKKTRVKKEYKINVGENFKTHANGEAWLSGKEGLYLVTDKALALISKSGNPIKLKSDNFLIKAAIKQANLTVDK